MPRRVFTLTVLAVPCMALMLSAQQLGSKATVPQMTPAAGIDFGDEMMTKGRYREAIIAYQRSRLTSSDPYQRVRAGAGEVKGILRMGGFDSAVDEAAGLLESVPGNPQATAVLGDALWAAGRFIEAEISYDKALSIDPADARALHGRGRALAAKRQLPEALAAVTAAVTRDPGEDAYLYTLADVLEQLRRYPEAADALDRYQAVMPDRKQNNAARWAHAQAELLRRFGSDTPFDIESSAAVTSGSSETFTVPFRIENDKVLVQARINGGRPIDVVVDTGAEHSSLTPDVARAAHVDALAVIPTAGIGERETGFRDLQMGRIDRLDIGPLHVKNGACFIKAPALTNLPITESQGFAPLALGLSVTIDYQNKVLTMGRQLPAEDGGLRLPLRMQRLAMVNGNVNTKPAAFIVDTGGELGLVVSGRVARGANPDPSLRHIPINVYGTAGRDKTAFVMPFVDIVFGRGVSMQQASVAVLNLDAPSWLLGIDIGGIVGHTFLSKYKVTFDLQRGELVLQ
jgi:Flp pilus assembly protein TadD/predicted aspartyl protease